MNGRWMNGSVTMICARGRVLVRAAMIAALLLATACESSEVADGDQPADSPDGFTTADTTTGNAQGDGAEIQKVNPGSAAEEGGLEEGDVITAVDGERVTDGIALIVSIRTHQPGETVEFTVRRGGEERQGSVQLRGQVG